MQLVSESTSRVLPPSHFTILPTHLTYIFPSTILHLILQTSKADVSKKYVPALMTRLLETDTVETSFGFSRKDESWEQTNR